MNAQSGLGLAASDKLDFFPFDPLNMRSADMKTKEVMNARLVRSLARCGLAPNPNADDPMQPDS